METSISFELEQLPNGQYVAFNGPAASGYKACQHSKVRSSQMSDVIFHHYPQSPVAEKVRVAFGMKAMSWHSAEIARATKTIADAFDRWLQAYTSCTNWG